MPIKLTTEILNNLSKTYGDAFYLLESDIFETNYKELSKAFKNYYSKFNIAYSYKTNYTPKLVKIVDELGGFAEVVSEMEMEVALKSGVSPNRIIWNGPIKNEEKTKELLLKGGTVNLDSIYEIKNIQTIAKNYPDHIINVGIRLNYDVGDGVLSRFGFDVHDKDYDLALRFIKDTSNINLISLQAHFAKRTPEFWTNRTEGMLESYERVISDYGMNPKYLDIGGGIYGKMPIELKSQLGVGDISFDDYATKAAKRFSDYFKDKENAPWLLIEPGTALAGDCMRFVSKVETIKKVRGKTIVTVLGSQKNIGMNGINPPIEVISGGRKTRFELKKADIVGYTCIEGDTLQKNFNGLLSIGDYVVFSNCGSYSIVMKPPFILPNFPIIEINNNNVEVIKGSESFDDLFHTFNI